MAPEVLIPSRFSAATEAGPDVAGRVWRLDGQAMGTGWSVRFVARAPVAVAVDAIRAGIDALLADLVLQLSHWAPESALCRYNRAAAGSRMRLPADFSAVLEAALDIARLSDGALDPTAGPLVDLWGFGPPGPQPLPPPAADLAAARRRIGWQQLQRDGDGLLQPGGVQLDFSAIAKGHAVDRLAVWLERAGFVHHLVEIGGELRGQGVKPDGLPWWVDAELPDGLAPCPARVALDGLSIATSGDAVRHVEHAGRRYAHTLDPRTGAPLADAPAAVTVIHPLCREADGWATALTVLGPAVGLPLADRLGLAARWQLRGAGPAVIRSAAWRQLGDDGDSD